MKSLVSSRRYVLRNQAKFYYSSCRSVLIASPSTANSINVHDKGHSCFVDEVPDILSLFLQTYRLQIRSAWLVEFRNKIIPGDTMALNSTYSRSAKSDRKTTHNHSFTFSQLNATKYIPSPSRRQLQQNEKTNQRTGAYMHHNHNP